MPRLKTVLQYPGSKARIAARIVSRFPAHTVYCEPFFGSGAILLAKPRSQSEIVNDLDGRVCNLFRVLRDQPEALARAITLTPYSRQELRVSDVERDIACDPVERARQFLVSCWQGWGKGCSDRSTGWVTDVTGRAGPVTRCHQWARLPDRFMAVADRLRAVQIECLPALDLIRASRNDAVLVYADPPYMAETRVPGLYRYEMSDTDHEALLDALCDHPGPVALSGYDCPLYRDRLGAWRCETLRSVALTGDRRVEHLWINRDGTGQMVLLES